MDVENNREMEHIPIIDVPLENMILRKEDLKITDNINSRKKEQINRNYDFLFSEEKSIKVHQLIDKYYSQLITQGMGIKSFATF